MAQPPPPASPAWRRERCTSSRSTRQPGGASMPSRALGSPPGPRWIDVTVTTIRPSSMMIRSLIFLVSTSISSSLYPRDLDRIDADPAIGHLMRPPAGPAPIAQQEPEARVERGRDLDLDGRIIAQETFDFDQRERRADGAVMVHPHPEVGRVERPPGQPELDRLAPVGDELAAGPGPGQHLGEPPLGPVHAVGGPVGGGRADAEGSGFGSGQSDHDTSEGGGSHSNIWKQNRLRFTYSRLGGKYMAIQIPSGRMR